MQSWKRKKNVQKQASKKWLIKLLAVFLILATFATAAYDFSWQWNQGVAKASEATGQNLSFLNIPESSFRLGLDLQGGTHLVYEADMSQIEDDGRMAALEGVRDVIERRVNAFGVSEPVVQTTTTGGTYRVIVELAGVLDVSDAIKQIGETPILEFKEENTEVNREATEEEQQRLDETNEQERQLAGEILDKALDGDDEEWAALGEEYNVNHLNNIVLEGGGLDTPLVQAVLDSKVKKGKVVPEVVESEEGLSIIKYMDTREAKNMELSHILICFEGKEGCQNPIPQLDASLQINNILKEATPENFADLAKVHSTDLASGQNGGYLEWVVPGETVPAFDLEAQMTPVGEISKVVETQFGYHIIYKQDEKEIRVYDIERILIPISTLTDLVGIEDQWKNTGLSGKQLKRAGVEFDPNTGVPYVTLQFDSEGADLFADMTERHVGQYIAIFLDGEPISIPVVNQAIYGGQAIITGNFTLEEAKLLAQRLNAGALPVPVNLLSQQTVGPTLGKISLEKSIVAALVGLILVALFMIALYRLPGAIAVLALLLYTMLNLLAYKIFGVTVTLAGIAGFVLSLGIAVDANVLIFERIRDELNSGRDLRSAIDEGFKRAWAPIRDGNLTTLIAAGVLYGFSASFIKGFALTLSIGVLLSLFTAIAVTRTYMRVANSCKPFQKISLYASVKKKEKYEN